MRNGGVHERRIRLLGFQVIVEDLFGDIYELQGASFEAFGWFGKALLNLKKFESWVIRIRIPIKLWIRLERILNNAKAIFLFKNVVQIMTGLVEWKDYLADLVLRHFDDVIKSESWIHVVPAN